MRPILTIILSLISIVSAYSQNNIKEKTIQNFYITCKAKKYSAFNHQQVGISRFEWRQYNRAIKRFQKSLEKDPTLCDSWYLIGYAQQKTGEFEKSVKSCRKAIKMNPNSYSAYIIMGYSYILLNDTTAALKSFETAKSIYPEKIDAYYGIALINYWKKDFNGVLNEYSDFEKQTNKDVSKKDIKVFKELINNIKIKQQ